MARHLKQSVALATASDRNVFFFARLKLTSIYVLILAIILVGFSATLYQSLSQSLTDANDENFSGVESHRQFVRATLGDVENQIVFIDLSILIAAAALSYVFAGYTLRPIQRAVEAQRIFSENASHELRTPLAVMKNDAEVLLRNPSPTKDLIHSTLRSNIEEIDRMTKMAKDLLALARSEHQIPVATEKIDVALTTKKVVEKMQPLSSRKTVSLTFTSDGHPLVFGSHDHLEHILLNLLQNAIEHTESNGSVAVVVSQEKSTAVITVSDTGEGIEQKDLPHIFERFYKGEGISGSGLGLSIVKGLVDRHGGSIEIESTKGTGTVATVRFPLTA